MSVTPERGAPAAAQERRRDAEHYRARAHTLRRLAREARSPEARSDLTALALRHERLADYLDTHSGDADPARAAGPE